jgi:hypothetical protein
MTQRKRLSRHFADCEPNNEVAMIFAFWKNNESAGLGLQYQLDDENVCAVFAEMFETYKKQYEDADAAGREKQIKCYQEQIINHKQLLCQKQGFEICLIANVWFLESLGLISSDEYNGVMVIHQLAHS